jgi:hypothetical protein
VKRLYAMGEGTTHEQPGHRRIGEELDFRDNDRN